MMYRKLRMGMVGGGRGSFIGKVHHMAAILDNQAELVCAALSSDPHTARISGQDYHLTPERTYLSFSEMITTEATLPPETRMDFLAVVTPNHLHFAPANQALLNGFHVICDKPLAFSLEEALELKTTVEKTGLVFAVTHAYHGYPMVKKAREMVAANDLGTIRKIMVTYTQGWLSEAVENQKNKQAAWRTDPTRAGESCTMGDIGVHAFELAEYISGLSVSALCADIHTTLPGRPLDDDGNVLLRFENGANGILVASQVCTGEENSVSIKVYGDKAGLEWQQMEPNSLIYRPSDGPMMILRAGMPPVSDVVRTHMRVPAGHPEGYIEAFANIYRNFIRAIHRHREGLAPEPSYDFPGIGDGVRGMLFIRKVMESGRSEAKWTKME